MKYTLRDENGDEEEVEAANFDEAKSEAIDWVRGGERDPISQTEDGGLRVEAVTVAVTITDEDDDETHIVVTAVDPDDYAPECVDGEDHDFRARDVFGGAMSHGGTAMSFTTFCDRCGRRRVERTHGSQRDPGKHDEVEWGPAGEFLGEEGNS